MPLRRSRYRPKRRSEAVSGPAGVRHPGVVQVDPAALDILAGLALRGGEAAGDEQIGQSGARRRPIASFIQVLGRDLADDVAKDRLADPVQPAAEHDLARPDGVGAGEFAVDQGGEGLGEALVRDPAAGVLVVFGREGLDLLPREKGEELEVAHGVAVVDVDEKLVKAVDAGLFRVQPDGAAAGGLAEF